LADLLGVSVEELVFVLKKKKARVPFEIGAFVALEACEAVLEGPARISVRDVRIGDDGAVSVFAPPNSSSAGEAAQSVVQVLAHLLVAAGPGVPPSLLELVERGPSDGRWDLSRLRDELEASLVPLNRSAARRVLSRMLREAARDGDVKKSSLPPPPPEDDVDAALDALVGGGVVPRAPRAPRVTPLVEIEPPPAARPSPVGPAPDRVRKATPLLSYGVPAAMPPPVLDPEDEPFMRDMDESSLETTRERDVPATPGMPSDEYEFENQETLVQDKSEPPPPMDAEPFRKPLPSVTGLLDELAGEEPPRAEDVPTSGGIKARQLGVPDSSPKQAVGGFDPGALSGRRGEIDLSNLDEVTRAKRSNALLYAILFVVLSGGLLGAVAVLRPDAIARFLGEEAPEDREARRLAEERRRLQSEIDQEHAARYGELVVDVAPTRTQVFLFLGRSPAEYEPLPVGIAHEFLAIADGKGPARAIVAPSETWEESDDGLLYELAIQASNEDMSFEDLALGATTLPRDMGAATGPMGKVRVVTTPRGAKVYLLIGFSPSVRVENMRTDRPVELLLWAENHRAMRHVLGPSDWTDADDGTGHRRARVDLVLEPLPGFEPEEEE
jgi:hypothetical protein